MFLLAASPSVGSPFGNLAAGECSGEFFSDGRDPWCVEIGPLSVNSRRPPAPAKKGAASTGIVREVIEHRRSD